MLLLAAVVEPRSLLIVLSLGLDAGSGVTDSLVPDLTILLRPPRSDVAALALSASRAAFCSSSGELSGESGELSGEQAVTFLNEWLGLGRDGLL